VSHPRYRFSSIYIALIDPNDRATPPQDVVTVFSDYHYQIWDISDYIAK
jgi:hypothetical protein